MTMGAQMELVFRPGQRAGKVESAQEDAARLVLFLDGKGWRKAATLAEALGWCDRRVRAAAEAADGRILSYPGSQGYCLTREATPEDRERAIAAFRSQARLMIRRSMAIGRVHHGRA